MKDNLLAYLTDKKIAILGFGREGKSSYQFIRKYFQEQPLTVFDANEKIKNDPLLLEDSWITIINQYNYEEILKEYDLVLKAPGISLKEIDITPYQNKISSQISLLLDFFDISIIGVTGTKGKSTTTSLIYEMIKAQKEDVLLGGNIGIPVFDNIEKITPNSTYVIELSAYQLQHIHTSPKISVLLNLFEEHIDFFGNLENYYNAKINIAKYQQADNFLIYKGDNLEIGNRISKNIKGKSYRVYDSEPKENKNNTIYLKENTICIYQNNEEKILYYTTDKRNLLGDNNLRDIMFVLGVCHYLKLDIEKAIQTINTFKGLPHRMEYVGYFDEIHYYNDSIATIPQATINNIETLKEVNTLIFGGMDRKIDYSDFVKYLGTCKVENLICMKETGYNIGKQLQKDNISKNIYFTETLEEAVEIAKSVTQKGKICMMSPAAPSYNQFKDFEQKSNKIIDEKYKIWYNNTPDRKGGIASVKKEV